MNKRWTLKAWTRSYSTRGIRLQSNPPLNPYHPSPSVVPGYVKTRVQFELVSMTEWRIKLRVVRVELVEQSKRTSRFQFHFDRGCRSALLWTPTRTFWKERKYKYCCNVTRIRQFKMQFKVVASLLLFFVAQAIADDQIRCLYEALKGHYASLSSTCIF
jgi:hypothetical protein